MTRRRRILVGLSLLVLILALGAGGWYWFVYRGPRASGPMAQGAYVWQRAWTDPVRDAVTSAGGDFDRLAYLAAEATVAPDGTLQVVRVRVDFDSLAAFGRPVVPTLRIPGNDAGYAQPTRSIVELAQSLVSEATSAGLEVAEFQVDYDCPVAELTGYEAWVRALKQALAQPVTITALPSWLRSSQFPQLARTTDGYVLQVHSLQRPEGQRPFLVDPAAARRAVDYAGMRRAPFRVALPTYGYELTWRDDALVDVTAEEPGAASDAATRKELLLARPDVMADLIAGWTRDRPACMEGVMWFRLPHAADRRNWQPVTLRTVMAGQTPTPNVTVEARQTQPGLWDIFAVNRGTADGALPNRVEVTHAGRRVAQDALGPYRAEIAETGRLVFVFNAGNGRLPAGREMPVGWIRTGSEHGGTVHVDVTEE